jgi:hypothetical protein
MSKECLECEEPIKGRIDKKFCSDLCRNAYNNKINSDTTNYVRNVNSILRKNRRILEGLIPEQTAKSTKVKLLDKGFNFGYYTNIYTTQKGVNYYFCYEYGYLPLENEYYFLVKRKENGK